MKYIDFLNKLDFFQVFLYLASVLNSHRKRGKIFTQLPYFRHWKIVYCCTLGSGDSGQLLEEGSKIALFNVWSYELSFDDVQSLNCLTHGDVASMEEFYILGFAGRGKLEMPCSPGECCILPKIKIHPYCPYGVALPQLQLLNGYLRRSKSNVVVID